MKSGFFGGGDARFPAPGWTGGSNIQVHWYGTRPTPMIPGDWTNPVDGSVNHANLYVVCDELIKGVHVTWVNLADSPDEVGLKQDKATMGNQTSESTCLTCSGGFIPSYSDARLTFTAGTTVKAGPYFYDGSLHETPKDGWAATPCCQPPDELTEPSYAYSAMAFVDGNRWEFYYGPLLGGTKYTATISWDCGTTSEQRLRYQIPGADTLATIQSLCVDGSIPKYESTSTNSRAEQVRWPTGVIGANGNPIGPEPEKRTNNFCCSTCAVPPAVVNGDLRFYATWYQLGASTAPDDIENARAQHGTVIWAYRSDDAPFRWGLILKRCNLGIFESADMLLTYTENPAFSYAHRLGGTGMENNWGKVFGRYTRYAMGTGGNAEGALLYEGEDLTDEYGQTSTVGGSFTWVEHLDCSGMYVPSMTWGAITWTAADGADHLDSEFLGHCGGRSVTVINDLGMYSTYSASSAPLPAVGSFWNLFGSCVQVLSNSAPSIGATSWESLAPSGPFSTSACA